MLTLFTTAKPFTGHNGIIQTNAIRSWLELKPKPEIIMIGHDEGVAEVCARYGLRHLPNPETNEYGTPLVSSLFSMAQEAASHDILCYVNADIILLSDFLPTIERVKKHSFLIIGQRWDLDIKEPLNFDTPGWESSLRNRLNVEGRLHDVTGIDYLVFRRGLYGDIPPLAVGRTSWDNWLVYQARKLKAVLIDATLAITAIHQNHDYSHHPQGHSGIWNGQEAVRNQELMGSREHGFTMEYANLILTAKGLKPSLAPRSIHFRMMALPILNPHLRFLLPLFRLLALTARSANSVATRFISPKK